MSINQPFNTAQLANMPVENGFRQRGHEMTRIEVLTDTAFAFAVTMLVISLNDIPRSFDELYASLKQVPALLASFAQVMLFWQAHVLWSRRFGLEDGPTIWLSAGLIFVMLVYVYLLRLLFSSAFAWFTEGWLPSEIEINHLVEVRNLFLLYGIGFMLLSGFLAALNLYALRMRERLVLNTIECFDTRTEILYQLTLAATAIVSMLIALLASGPWLALSGMVYATLGISMPMIGILRGRQHERLLQPAAAESEETLPAK